MKAYILSDTGRQMMSRRLRVFSTDTTTLVICKLLQSEERPMSTEELEGVLVGTRIEDRTWTPALVKNVVRRLNRLGILKEIEE